MRQWTAIAVWMGLAVAVVAAAAAAQPAVAGPAAADTGAKIEAVRAAYRAVETASMGGTFSLDAVRAGKAEQRSTAFTAFYARPDVFRQELTDESVVGSTGELAYAYLKRINSYRTTPVDPDVQGIDRFGPFVISILRGQNPSLAMLLAEDPTAELSQDASQLRVQGEGLTVATDAGTTEVTFDPETGLIRKVVVDVTPSLKKRGDDTLEKAVITIEYVSVETGVAVPEAMKRWTAPPSARDAAALDPKPAEEAGPGEEAKPGEEPSPGGRKPGVGE